MTKKKKGSSAAIGPAIGGDMARKIWLAGIGAYGRAFSEAQESLAKVSGDTTKLFEDLVERGEEIEDTVETRGREIAKRIKTSDFSMDERIKEMRARLKAGVLREAENDDTPYETTDTNRLDSIEARLDEIEAAIGTLQAAQSSQAKTKRKKASTKKSAD